ncbi:DNA polymerase family A-domain-containing protein [Sordaria brevicollis]|uniref:DNA-directed DNA polymerase n=1 Tax=Sordaria brevicollis TaxID=83679 RepID=A0AAE0P1T2_SORBR|nr:DNA polymerase family A-domain-containing protein [Sordaria brevicollis]
MLTPVRCRAVPNATVATAARVLRGANLFSRYPRQLRHLRWDSTVAEVLERKGLAIPSTARHNEIGVQQLSEHMYKQLFPRGNTDPPAPELIELAKDHLARHDLLGKTTDKTPPIAFQLPSLVGETLDEHFHKLGVDAAEPFLTHAKHFAGLNLPPKPTKWVRRSGWTKYNRDGTTENDVLPEGNMMSFDTEVMYKDNPYAVMACAGTPDAWYAWISPWLLGETEEKCQLVPLGDTSVERIIVGHNIGFDRAKILEEYDLKQTRNFFLDTMSLHVAVNGMCSQQRPTWMKHKKAREVREKAEAENASVELQEVLQGGSLTAEEADLWIDKSSINSLRDVAEFHLGVKIDKQIRDVFAETDRNVILNQLDELLTYCAADVQVTHQVYQVVFPHFLSTCPHPVSFAALRHLASVILPVNKTWDHYIETAEATYLQMLHGVQERLITLMEQTLDLKSDPEKYLSDPWLSQLDWSVQEIKYVKGKKKDDPERPALNQRLPGYPQWYKDLFLKLPKELSAWEESGKEQENRKARHEFINLSVRTRIAPLLLKLSWEGYPLFWSDEHGWTFRVPREQAETFIQRQMTPLEFEKSEVDEKLSMDDHHKYFKLPHKDGPTARCTNPMAKGYLGYFEKGVLSSEYPYAKEALDMNASCSYWISARERIKNQMVVYEDQLPASQRFVNKDGQNDVPVGGFVLPQVIPMGTITRRAVERTWLTASNAKKNRVGSELKAMVRAPPGYVFVGADVDSEELWIASVVGDATFKLHGGNAIGFMTLEGTKSQGTDLHSRTAAILGITRNDAKVFNYGRIYGAGLKFASQLLRQFNPSLTEAETIEIATRLYDATKGAKTNRKSLYKRPFWRGGTESFVFNMLEEFAEQERPRTPVLGAGITEALMSRWVSKGGFLTSRINWAIQSSGVDYLHLLIIAMDYLTRRFNLACRLAITVHDEIRYLSEEHDKYRVAMALQIANLWTRVMFAQQVGIQDLPQSCAFFSAVDIDHVLRKEVDMDCLTPSNPIPIPHGESIDIFQLLDKGEQAKLDENIVPEPDYAPQLDNIEYKPRVPVMQQLRSRAEGGNHKAFLRFIRAQIANSDVELKKIIAETRYSEGLFSMSDDMESADAYERRAAVRASRQSAFETSSTSSIANSLDAVSRTTTKASLENRPDSVEESLWRESLADDADEHSDRADKAKSKATAEADDDRLAAINMVTAPSPVKKEMKAASLKTPVVKAAASRPLPWQPESTKEAVSASTPSQVDTKKTTSTPKTKPTKEFTKKEEEPVPSRDDPAIAARLEAAFKASADTRASVAAKLDALASLAERAVAERAAFLAAVAATKTTTAQPETCTPKAEKPTVTSTAKLPIRTASSKPTPTATTKPSATSATSTTATLPKPRGRPRTTPILPYTAPKKKLPTGAYSKEQKEPMSVSEAVRTANVGAAGTAAGSAGGAAGAAVGENGDKKGWDKWWMGQH